MLTKEYQTEFELNSERDGRVKILVDSRISKVNSIDGRWRHNQFQSFRGEGVKILVGYCISKVDRIIGQSSRVLWMKE